MAQKRKSLKKSFRKNNRSTRRKSKTNKRKSRKIGGGAYYSNLNSTSFAAAVESLNNDVEDGGVKRGKIKELIEYPLSCSGFMNMGESCRNRLVTGYGILISLIDKYFTNPGDINKLKGIAEHKKHMINENK